MSIANAKNNIASRLRVVLVISNLPWIIDIYFGIQFEKTGDEGNPSSRYTSDLKRIQTR